ncbi:phosphatidylinositol alpha 1,6-mannosyltransferase [Aurantimicrobium minutum]|uniref:glycosyltransferase family 4 protein n=1 Tax=Aurantimicrobium minutum TaxID=708131 RepID=UPI0024755098|nr:glycosyltransferase family 1 protein [Aurantimicrobium minutum]MDH6531988.1 phosphatidylinositol alpha 1,6-mannosyltransferase [Aurantimicrobium minutum]
MSMRIAIVTESFLPSLNGVTNSVLRVVDTLKEAGHEVIIIAPTAPQKRHLGFKVIRTLAVPLMQFQIGLPPLALEATLEEFQPDVVHVASPFFLGGQAIAIANKLGIPTVAIYQTDIAGYLQRYGMRFAKPVVDRFVAAIHGPATMNLAPTPESAAYLLKLGVERVGVWGRGVDLELFHPRNKSEQATQEFKNTHLLGKKNLVGFVGRLAPEKQVHRMLELCSIPDTALVIVGDGPERKKLEALFAGKPVTFTGALRGAELARAYASLDAFVHYGTEETFGQTIQEAQASAVPVVAPAVGGPRFLITDHENGRLIDPEVTHGFTEAVVDILATPRLAARMGEAGRRSVLNKSWKANNESLLKTYRAAAAFKGSAFESSPELV